MICYGCNKERRVVQMRLFRARNTRDYCERCAEEVEALGLGERVEALR